MATALSADKAILQSFKENIEPLLDNYCFDCHGLGVSEGDITLDEFSEDTIRDHELWQRVLKNTRVHIMPPREELQPDEEERNALATWIKRVPFGIDPLQPDPGRVTVRRLNRIEYQNTIYDLMGVEFNALDAFPADDSGEGFDNLGDLLTLSPMLLEKYLDAANAIVSQAVPTTDRVQPEQVFTGKDLVALFSPAPPGDEDPDKLQMSFYAPSARSAVYEATKAGDYQLVLKIKPVSFSSFNGFDYNQCQFRFKADGAILIDQPFEFTSGKVYEFKFDRQWSPGRHTFTAEVEPLTFDLEKIKNLKMEIETLTVRGPLGPEHRVPPPNYETFFPGGVPDKKSARRRYSRTLLTHFATRAFRRPVDGRTVNRLVDMAEAIASQPGYSYEEGIGQAMVAVLASPRFLFREEAVSPKSRNEIHPYIDEYSLASRLSYFLWSTMPDETLFQLASENKLRENIEIQVERMLADKRSDNFILNFAGQWLHARDIEGINISSLDVWLRENPDPHFLAARAEYERLKEIPESKRTPEEQEAYKRTREIVVALYRRERPELKGDVKRAMKRETERYFAHVIRENRPLSELIDSDYTFLNEKLATHYGIEGVTGSEVRKVDLASDSPRGGVLTQGTVLAFTSNPTRTSPVKRGVFVLENILGTPPAPPPPNIPALEDVAGAEEIAAMSLRETLALHREQPLCSSCHQRMDPLGLALENFNAMGMWRESEMNQLIETDGMLITGETFSSVQEMKRILATEHIRDFYYCFSEKLLTYALGRGLEYYDTETLDILVNHLEKRDGRPSALLMAIVQSVPFQKRRHSDFKPH